MFGLENFDARGKSVTTDRQNCELQARQSKDTWPCLALTMRVRHLTLKTSRGLFVLKRKKKRKIKRTPAVFPALQSTGVWRHVSQGDVCSASLCGICHLGALRPALYNSEDGEAFSSRKCHRDSLDWDCARICVAGRTVITLWRGFWNERESSVRTDTQWDGYFQDSHQRTTTVDWGLAPYITTSVNWQQREAQEELKVREQLNNCQSYVGVRMNVRVNDGLMGPDSILTLKVRIARTILGLTLESYGFVLCICIICVFNKSLFFRL